MKEDSRLQVGMILSQLSTQGIGQQLNLLPEVSSTNTFLMELPAAESPHGLVVTTEHQTGGHGRHGRAWFSPRGANLAFSVCLRPKAHPGGLATLAGACAVVAVLREKGIRAAIKWPNDITLQQPATEVDGTRIFRDLKLGGVLCESRAESDQSLRLVLGIGLNVNISHDQFPEDLRNTASSLRAACGKILDRNRLLAALLNRLEEVWRQLESEGSGELVRTARGYCETLGHMVRVDLGGWCVEGIAEDLDPQGCLVLRLESGVKRVLGIGAIQQTRRID